jgi:hypothetical protein
LVALALVAIDECLEGIEGEELEIRASKLRAFIEVCEKEEDEDEDEEDGKSVPDTPNS